MREGWTYKKLGEVATFITDGDWIESKDQSDNGIRLIQTGNVGNGFFKSKEDKPHFISEDTMDRLDCTEIFEGDCLVSRLPDPVGRACIIPNIGCRMITAVDCSIIRFGDNYLPHFFVNYSQSSKYRNSINNNTTGTTRKRISRKNLEKIPIPLPPLSEQERIVSELDLLSSVIEKKKAQLKELDNLAQSIFYDMFGDPVENEKGWEVKTIGEIASFHNGKAHENDIDENGKYILINAKFISSEGVIQKRTNKQLFSLFENDIVMVMSDVPNGKALARCYLVKCNNLFSLNQRICAFRDYTLNSLFLFFVLNRNKYFLRFDDGNGQTNLRKKEVLGCPVIQPPLSLQQQFAEKIEAIEKQKEKIKQSIAETETLFNSRMDYWFS